MSETLDRAIEKAPVADTPYKRVMDTWARWMTLTNRQISDGMANPQDVKEFMACGEAVDSMVNDLPRHQWWAVYKAFGMTTAWNFPQLSWEEELVAAEQKLSVKMQKNVATRRYFN
ncbi:hypothetical protein [Pseudoduganella chitinolytica]|uniref:Uncharacterized protein n=1 Tax=Pseudoduganella chitinolytica TaxID=34070 RepID=A0ABY8BG43_9BURK|nr:hypothetical protein [Pseudoduganella chitinolytica]WEF34874.1 hypothetical protein PX653_08975 [Pseudoduganella chitinolytica]